MSKEVTAGPFNRALFIWLNKLLRAGWQVSITPNTLPPTDERLCLDKSFRRLHHSFLSGTTTPPETCNHRMLQVLNILQSTINANMRCLLQ
jgi:hypothetical protein